MKDKNTKHYRGFNKNLTKEDLSEDELECYNKFMDSISGVSEEEKEEVARLMDLVIESEVEEHNNCLRCGKEFNDKDREANGGGNTIYCSKCLMKMWNIKAVPKFID